MSEILDWKLLASPEKKRKYIFPNGNEISFENVVKVCIRPSGSHRLEMSSGQKAVVASGWLAILLEVDDWSF